MKNGKIAAAALALLMGFSTLASADPRHDRDDRRGGPHAHQKHHGKGHAHGHDKHHRHDDRYRPGRGGPDRHVDYRGAGPDHRWHRGDRLPMQYRSRQYVVEDWRGHRLSAPPRGYHWVQAGGDYVLVAIATGVIATLLLSQ